MKFPFLILFEYNLLVLHMGTHYGLNSINYFMGDF